MRSILALHSSPRPGDLSVSRNLTNILVQGLVAALPGVRVLERDLAQDPPPHVGMDLFSGVRKQPSARTRSEEWAVQYSEMLITEVLDADLLVIGAPMYNFGVPTVLKSWIDHISIPKRTFQYQPDGTAKGLVTGKQVLVVTSRGGEYGNTGPEAGNFADSHVRVALELLGMVDLHVIAADWQGFPPTIRKAGHDAAVMQITKLLNTIDK